MAGPWEKYSTADKARGITVEFPNAQGAGPWSKYAQPERRMTPEQREQGMAELKQDIAGRGLGIGDAIATSLAQGMTFGFSDEIENALNPGGDGLATERVNALREKYPWLFLAGEIAGGVATGGALAKGGATLVGRTAGKGLGTRMAAASAEGAGYGALYGAGTADEGERGAGALVGGTTGAVAGPVFEAGASGVRAIERSLRGKPTRATSPAYTEAQSEGIPLTRGQATGNYDDIAFEEAARHGAKGGLAQRVISSADDAQAEAIDAAKTRMQAGLGGQMIDNPAQAGDLARDAISARAQALKQEAQGYYTQSAQGAAQIDAQALGSLGSRVRDAIGPMDEILSPELTPAANRVLQVIERFSDVSKRFPGENVVSVQLEGLERVRQIVTGMKGANANDARVIGQIRNAFDGWLDDAVDNALFSGNDEALAALKKARNLWSRYRAITSPRKGDDAGAVLAKMAEKDVDAVEATNWLLGTAAHGMSGKGVRLVRRVKEELGADSEAFKSIRQAMWLKLTRNPSGKDQPGPQAVSQAIFEFTAGKGQALARELFSREELAKMRKFASILKSTVPDPKAMNPSKSGFTVGRMAQGAFDNVMGAIGLAEGGIGAGVAARLAAPLFREGKSAARAASNVNNPLPRIPVNPTPALPAAAGAVSSSLIRE